MLTTARLVLRRWCAADREPFAALNADPEVMAHLPARLSRAESDAMVDRIEAHWDAHGFGLAAVEHRGAFLGYCGLTIPSYPLPFAPCVEIGWRFARAAWGHGYATEAARAALEYGFARGLPEIVSFTVAANTRSRAVMERLGMQRDLDGDFAHPRSDQPHVLYRISR
ncbi:MAG TPA: GNAT family N-acetyltransferase [Kofleriaceae bacterium]|jgi:ribosomal-protein-alanine N-acetyltransferase